MKLLTRKKQDILFRLITDNQIIVENLTKRLHDEPQIFFDDFVQVSNNNIDIVSLIGGMKYVEKLDRTMRNYREARENA